MQDLFYLSVSYSYTSICMLHADNRGTVIVLISTRYMSNHKTQPPVTCLGFSASLHSLRCVTEGNMNHGNVNTIASLYLNCRSNKNLHSQ